MASPVDIVNRALSKLGGKRIASMDDNTVDARLASSLYEIVRDAEMSAYAWSFAKHRKRIPAEADPPAFGWARQYLLPSDCLRVLEAGPWPQAVMADYIGGDTSEYTIEGGRLLTNQGPALNLIYLRRIEDSGLYPAIFIEALACKLAVEMTEALTAAGAGKRQLAWQEYEHAIKTARRHNAIQRPPVKIQDDTWATAHMLGSI